MARQKIFLVSAPSGAGKTSVISAALDKNSNLERVITHTTRKPRANEVDGRDYYFITKAQFDADFKREQIFRNGGGIR